MEKYVEMQIRYLTVVLKILCIKIKFWVFLQEINENLKRLLSEKENLQSKLDAEKHVMRAQLRDMMEKHELEMTKVREKYNAELHEIQEKHETELQEKDQALFQLKKQVAELSGSGQTNSKEVRDPESITKEKMKDLEGILFKQLHMNGSFAPYCYILYANFLPLASRTTLNLVEKLLPH